MKRYLLLVLLLSFSCLPAVAAEIDGILNNEGGVDAGVFCHIDSAEVCVVARSEEDCTKLEGKKVDQCPSSQVNK